MIEVPATQIVYESLALPTANGGTVALRLLVAPTGEHTEIRIDREEQLPHKTLKFAVLKINEPTIGIEPLARAMTTIAHELERLHRQGYSLRERAGGGWRGAWHAELTAASGSPAIGSWEIEPRKPWKTLLSLVHVLSSLDVPTVEIGRPHGSEALAAVMRDHGDEVRRNHAVDALIAADPTMPTDEFLDELERRRLLSPNDGDLENRRIA